MLQNVTFTQKTKTVLFRITALFMLFLAVRSLYQKIIYLAASLLFLALSHLFCLISAICWISPWNIPLTSGECLFFSKICNQIVEQSTSSIFSSPKNHPHDSWKENEKNLSNITVSSLETTQLIQFLKQEWLTKANGFFNAEIFWMSPLFEYPLQTHPDTTNCYARDPYSTASKTYLKRVNSWKKSLPHPLDFPLILTRPFSLENDLPNYFKITSASSIETTLPSIAKNTFAILDITEILKTSPHEWMQSWSNIKTQILSTSHKHSIDLSHLIVIENMLTPSIGGLRILPLFSKNQDKIHQILLQSLSHLGLSATLIELNRNAPQLSSTPKKTILCNRTLLSLKENLLSFSNPLENNLLTSAMTSMIQTLLLETPLQKWEEISTCPTRTSIAILSLHKIKEKLETIQIKKNSFFPIVSLCEEINCHLISLLEILSPFSHESFQTIYANVLPLIPDSLKPFSAYALHSCGMSSLSGILKANKNAPILYGENTYFETIHLLEKENATSITCAQKKDWENVRLILTQLNPVLKRDFGANFSYNAENIEEIIHKVIAHNPTRPFTVAIDITLDAADSEQLKTLIQTFTQPIKQGLINLVFYKSGLKFDLFGLDHCAVAPFFMIHNHDPKWMPFTALCQDQTRITDPLSINWLSLAYKAAFPLTKEYRNLIVKNTQTLLTKIPKELSHPKNTYRVIPFKTNAEPTFIDIRVSGPLHQLKAAALIGGSLTLHCVQEKYPLFYRRSFGFYHPNFGLLFGDDSSTIRLTLGLDPSQIDLFVKWLSQINTLNAK